MDEIVQVISTLGFPIAISVYLLWNMEKQRQESRQDSEKWCEAINRNSSIMEKVLDAFNNK